MAIEEVYREILCALIQGEWYDSEGFTPPTLHNAPLRIIDFSGTDVAVAECGLDQPKVSGVAVEVHGKGVARGVNCEVARDTSLLEPMMEAELDLTSTQWATIA